MNACLGYTDVLPYNLMFITKVGYFNFTEPIRGHFYSQTELTAPFIHLANVMHMTHGGRVVPCFSFSVRVDRVFWLRFEPFEHPGLVFDVS